MRGESSFYMGKKCRGELLKQSLVPIVLLIAAIVGCSASRPAAPPGQDIAPKPGEPKMSGANEGDTFTPMEERRIVRTGNISLVVQEVAGTRDRVAQLAMNLGGYVVSSTFAGDEQDISGKMSIRIPTEKFDQALVELRALALRVASESIVSKDITEEFIDLQSRLRNAEATEKQFVSLLERATDVESTLKVYERLKQVRQEIEQLKGRVQFLEQSASTSIITVQLDSAATARPMVRSGWDGIEQFKSAVRGLVVAVQIVATLAIWIAIFSPLWATPLTVIYWRNRRKKSNVPKPQE